MRKIMLLLSMLIIFFNLKAQLKEPDFIGEAYLLTSDSTIKQLDKEIANFKEHLSLKVNGTALSIFVEGKYAQTKIKSSDIKLIIKTLDNNSDPLSIIKIFKFDTKKNTRVSILSVDRSGSLLASRTYSKNQIKFEGKKYGSSSYLISLTDLKIGEYGIIVSNPNNQDEKRKIISCFSIIK